MSEKIEQGTEITESLWLRFLSGDEEVFTLLYHRLVQLLFSYGLHFTSDREAIKDGIQEVFIKLYRNRNELKHIRNIRTYLFISLKNHLINTLKKDQIHLKYIRTADFSDIDDDTAEKQLICKETDYNTQKKIEDIMASLSPRQKKAVYYRYIDNLSIEEIGNLMKMNQQSVQNILQRAIKKAKNVFLVKK